MIDPVIADSPLINKLRPLHNSYFLNEGDKNCQVLKRSQNYQTVGDFGNVAGMGTQDQYYGLFRMDSLIFLLMSR